LNYPGKELTLFSAATHWKQYFSQKIGPYLSGDVLEVGAGLGGTTQSLLKFARGPITSWTALEPDPDLYSVLKNQNIPSLNGKRISYIHGTLHELPPEARQFDVILYVDVLEHILADREEIQFASQFLKPQGRLVVLAPAHNFLTSPFDQEIGHHRRYCRRSLRDLRGSLFQSEHSSYLDSAGLLLSLANAYLLKKAQPSMNDILFWDRFVVPVSKLLDYLSRYHLGKSILEIWTRT